MTSGYSGTPLVKKLGIIAGGIVAISDEPDGFHNLLEGLPPDVEFRAELTRDVDLVMLFVTERSMLQAELGEAADAIFPDGAIWVAWPKRASKVPTDVTEDVVRDAALPLGLVDNKVCAIDAVWSGLRVVWRREHRG